LWVTMHHVVQHQSAARQHARPAPGTHNRPPPVQRKLRAARKPAPAVEVVEQDPQQQQQQEQEQGGFSAAVQRLLHRAASSLTRGQTTCLTCRGQGTCTCPACNVSVVVLLGSPAAAVAVVSLRAAAYAAHLSQVFAQQMLIKACWWCGQCCLPRGCNCVVLVMHPPSAKPAATCSYGMRVRRVCVAGLWHHRQGRAAERDAPHSTEAAVSAACGPQRVSQRLAHVKQVCVYVCVFVWTVCQQCPARAEGSEGQAGRQQGMHPGPRPGPSTTRSRDAPTPHNTTCCCCCTQVPALPWYRGDGVPHVSRHGRAAHRARQDTPVTLDSWRAVRNTQF
jgi:hypothetical protein